MVENLAFQEVKGTYLFQVFFLTDSVALVLHRPYSMVETPDTVTIRWFVKSVLQDAVISTQEPAVEPQGVL